jgi:hypothetical protein
MQHGTSETWDKHSNKPTMLYTHLLDRIFSQRGKKLSTGDTSLVMNSHQRHAKSELFLSSAAQNQAKCMSS